MILAVSASAALRAPIVYPFPSLAGQDDAIMTAGAPVEQAQAVPTEDQAIAPWHAPTLKPDTLLTSTSTEMFKHPTAEMVKDWETAPKVEMFETPTMKPMEEMIPKEEVAAAPVEEVKSKIVPVDPYAKKDSDPELSAIQQNNPMAYAIVKALLMKKAMGLPMPGATAQSTADAKDESNIPSSSGAIGNMWNWHPQASAADEMAEVEEGSSVSKAEPVEEPEEAAPVAAEETAEAPAAASAPVEEPAAPSRTENLGASLGSWLGTSAVVAPAAPVEAAPAAGGNALLSKYAMDLN